MMTAMMMVRRRSKRRKRDDGEVGDCGEYTHAPSGERERGGGVWWGALNKSVTVSRQQCFFNEKKTRRHKRL